MSWATVKAQVRRLEPVAARRDVAALARAGPGRGVEPGAGEGAGRRGRAGVLDQRGVVVAQQLVRVREVAVHLGDHGEGPRRAVHRQQDVVQAGAGRARGRCSAATRRPVRTASATARTTWSVGQAACGGQDLTAGGRLVRVGCHRGSPWCDTTERRTISDARPRYPRPGGGCRSAVGGSSDPPDGTTRPEPHMLHVPRAGPPAGSGPRTCVRALYRRWTGLGAPWM